MKTLQKLTVLLAFAFMGMSFTVADTNNDPRKLLVRKWKFDIEHLRKMVLEDMRKEGASEEEIEQGKLFVDMMLGMMDAIRLEFKADGTVINTGGGDEEDSTGHWTLSADGKTLTLSSPDGEETILNVVSITKDELIIHEQDRPEVTQRLVPAND
jgi:hypothetical protein